MSGNADAILQQALNLPPEERELVAEVLRESLVQRDPKIEKAWIEECQRRSRAIDAGEMGTVPWDEVKRSLREKYPQAQLDEG